MELQPSDMDRLAESYRCILGILHFIDDQIQRIFNCLEENGLADNTIIIFSTDHGDMLGSHRLFNKGFHMYEETHHIPLLVRWNGVTSPGTTCDEFVNLVDLMPTFLEIGGADLPNNLDGRSLCHYLEGKRLQIGTMMYSPNFMDTKQHLLLSGWCGLILGNMYTIHIVKTTLRYAERPT